MDRYDVTACQFMNLVYSNAILPLYNLPTLVTLLQLSFLIWSWTINWTNPVISLTMFLTIYLLLYPLMFIFLVDVIPQRLIWPLIEKSPLKNSTSLNRLCKVDNGPMSLVRTILTVPITPLPGIMQWLLWNILPTCQVLAQERF